MQNENTILILKQMGLCVHWKTKRTQLYSYQMCQIKLLVMPLFGTISDPYLQGVFIVFFLCLNITVLLAFKSDIYLLLFSNKFTETHLVYNQDCTNMFVRWTIV